MNYSIVISCYKREKALKRLIKSLQKVNFASPVDIYLSVDFGGKNFNFCESIKISSKNLKIIRHKKRLGLVNQFHFCGNLTEELGPVVFLEEDMLVSPTLDSYVRTALKYYSEDDSIAAINLMNMPFDEFTGTHVDPIDDGSSVYFTQLPYWGKIWTPDKWQAFKLWLQHNQHNLEALTKQLPMNIQNWPASSFKRTYITYLHNANKWVVTPRNSYVTNAGLAGEHADALYQYQANLSLSFSNFNYVSFNNSISKYDSHNELLVSVVKKLQPALEPYDFCVDLHGTREIFDKEFVLTSRKVKKSLLTFDGSMKPTEIGLLMSDPALISSRSYWSINLARSDDVIISNKDIWHARVKDMMRYTDLSMKRLLVVTAMRFLKIK